MVPSLAETPFLSVSNTFVMAIHPLKVWNRVQHLTGNIFWAKDEKPEKNKREKQRTLFVIAGFARAFI
jgi:hypothetical protein